MIDCVCNVYKGKRESNRKRALQQESRRNSSAGILLNPDEVSVIKALEQEVSELLELMKLTYNHRREFVLTAASSVEEILTKFPALHQPDVVSHTTYMYVYTYL